jgi:surfeit locus 1 family protein
MEDQSRGRQAVVKPEKRLWPFLLASGLGILILCALGAWQIARLGEKEKLLAELDARASAPPLSLSQALAKYEAGEDIAFLHVEARGTFVQERELHKQAAFKGGPGWQVITPFISDGIAVLVDRGAVPDQFKTYASRTENAAPTQISGVVRTHQGGRGIFDPDNDEVGNIWYWWDLPAMQAAASLPPTVKVAPFVLQLLPQPGGPKYPQASPPDTGIRNNHLQYAITWFSLAVVLAVIALLFALSQRRA